MAVGYNTLEKRREYARKWRSRHPEYARDAARKRRKENLSQVREVKHAYYMNNLEKNKVRQKQYYQANTEKCKAYSRNRILKKCFNLLPEDYQKIIDYQGGCCAICKRKPTQKKLHVDHDHSSGLIRGGLCWKCNRVVGFFYDKPELFETAASYLRNPPASLALGAPRFGLPGRLGTKRQKKLIKEKENA